MTAELTRPPGKRVPIDPRSIPSEISLLDWRMTDPGGWPEVLPRVLPVGLVLVIGRPGVAKTTLSDQFEHCIAARVPVAGWAPDEPGRVLVIDYEGGPHLAINRSARIAEPGTLPTDETGDPDKRIIVSTQWPGDTWGERIAELEKRLLDAEHDGQPYSLVRIDTMRAFVGPVPQGMNTAQYESDCLVALNRLAVRFGICILLIHHPNKAGEVSGSVAIEGSCTAVYRIDRKPGECQGRLVCLKNRVGQERSWPMLFDQGAGTWFISDQITDAQAANSGVRRAVLDWLVEHGPAKGPELRAGLAGSTTDATLKNAITRLAGDGWLMRDREGVWSVAGQSVQPCEVCGEPMTVVHAGQTAHPNCGPPAVERPPLPWGPGVPGDAYVDKPAAGVEVEGGELANVVPFPAPPSVPLVVHLDPGEAAKQNTNGTGGPVEVEHQAAACELCGLPITPEDPHPGCEPPPPGAPKWPGVRILAETLKASRLRPVPYIAAEGDPRGQREGHQHRGMEQWQRAAEASTCEHRWRMPGLLDTYGPGRLVVAFDRGQSYPAAASSVPLAPGLLYPHGPLDRDPRELGKPNPNRKSGHEGMAGIVRVTVPAWDRPGIGHPLGARAVPGESRLISTASLEGLWNLHNRGQLPAVPVVTESWLGGRATGVLEQFANRVRAARDEYRADPVMTAAVKLGSSIALRLLHPVAASSPHWRPDWRAGMAGEAAFRLWVVALAAVEAGEVCCSLSTVDQACFLLPEGADPDTWTPHGYKPGKDWGEVKRVPVEIRADRADLSGIDPARITPAVRRGYLSISGPVPLGAWVMSRA
jgi:AAA domain